MLTVVTCNYNHAQYLQGAIDSVADQKYTPIEHILIDDGSTDHSRDIIQAYAERAPWVRTYFHKENKGVLYSINEALSLATGKYIHFLSADDLILKDFFRTSVAALEANPHVGLCCSQSCFFHKDISEQIQCNEFHIGAESRTFSPQEVMNLYKKTKFWISGSNILRLDLARRYGFNPQIEAFNDWFLYQQIALLHGVAYIPRVFYANRGVEAGYANSVWCDEKRRNRSFYNLVNAVLKHESTPFRKAFRKGASLAFYGKKMFVFLLKHPRFWRYLPDILLKKLKEKIFKKR